MLEGDHLQKTYFWLYLIIIEPFNYLGNEKKTLRNIWVHLESRPSDNESVIFRR